MKDIEVVSEMFKKRSGISLSLERDSGDESMQPRERRQLSHVVRCERGAVGGYEALCWRCVFSSRLCVHLLILFLFYDFSLE